MQSIYIHIPFCKQACHYCDFHFSTNRSAEEDMTAMICREIELQKDYLIEKTISSIYFGGGTPSLLKEHQLSSILNTVYKYFTPSDDCEITLEANPDDLSISQLKILKSNLINRLSIGVQSFHDEQLQYLNRAHKGALAYTCVKDAQDNGFDNISIDLIFAIPSQDHSLWQYNLSKAAELSVQHISSYCLTIEPQTVFGHRVKKNMMPGPDEEFGAQQFEILMNFMEKEGYLQYEISNFCRPGFMSRHNSSYWLNNPYLGIGPSAHSYNLSSRQHNISSNALFIESLKKNNIPFTKEILSAKDKTNEYLLTNIRTSWGVNMQVLREKYGIEVDTFEPSISNYIREGMLTLENDVLKLSKSGKLIADKITEDFFIL